MPSPRRTRRVGIGILAILTVLAGPLIWTRTMSVGSGPLKSSSPDVWASTGLPVMHRGAVFTVTQVQLHNRGNRPVTIDRVALIRPPHQLRVQLVQAFVVHQPRTSPVFAAGVVGPPRKWYHHLQPARGAIITTHEPQLVSLGVEVTAPPGFAKASRFRFAIAEGIQVYYHSGASKYVDSWHTQIVLCHGSCNKVPDSKWPPPPIS